VLPSGTALTNAKFIRVNSNLTSTGDNDLYTVPTGKRAYFLILNALNNSASTLTAFSEAKISGTYYKTLVQRAHKRGILWPNAGGVRPLCGGSRESISININQQPVVVSGFIVEFDNTAGLKSSKLTSLSSGNNSYGRLTRTTNTAPVQSEELFCS
jgi:hypothetical protein